MMFGKILHLGLVWLLPHLPLTCGVEHVLTRRYGSVYLGVVELRVCEVCYVNEGYVGSEWYCIFEGLVEMCQVAGLQLYWKLIVKIMGVVCESNCIK